MDKNIEEIKTLLSNSSIQPSPEWVVKTRNNLIDRINADSKSAQINFLTKVYMNTKVFAASALAVVVAVSGVGLATVSAAKVSKPGDFLFGLSKAIENVQRSTLTNSNDKLAFEKELLVERLNELNDLKNSKDSVKIALGLKEVSEQQDNLKKVEDNCTDASCVETEVEIHKSVKEAATEVKDSALNSDNSNLTKDAQELEKKSLENAQEAEKKALEQQQEAAKQAAEKQSEAEKHALEQQQEEAKKALEQQQEAEKNALEEQHRQEENHSGSNSGSGSSSEN